MMVRTLLPAGFGGVDPPDPWPRPSSAPRPEALERPVETLPGVGPTAKRRLARLGLHAVGDLLTHRPRRYEQPVPERRIVDLFGDEEVVIEGVVRRASGRRRGRLHVLTAHVADDTGEIRATWFNQPWLEQKLTAGARVRLRGRQNRFGFAVDSYDLDETHDTADFAPVYPASEELSQKQLRGLVEAALADARAEGDPLPAALRAREGLPLRADAVVAVHRPRSLAEAEEGRRRLAFDELLVLQLALARRAAEREALVATALPVPGEFAARYRSLLPFTLTEAQERAISEIDADLGRTTPMQRLLQGDVGSGKTVVALYALLRATEAGRQAALMAPTEVLAELRRARSARLAAYERTRSEGARAGSAAGRVGRRADPRRHARADSEGGRVPRSCRRSRRRAAPFRCRAEKRTRGGAIAACAPYDGNADSAHARPHGLR